MGRRQLIGQAAATDDALEREGQDGGGGQVDVGGRVNDFDFDACTVRVARTAFDETDGYFTVFQAPTQEGTRPCSGGEPDTGQDGTGEQSLHLGKPLDDSADRGPALLGDAVRTGTAAEEGCTATGEGEVLVGAIADRAGEGCGREGGLQLVCTGDPADNDLCQHHGVRCCERIPRGKRDLKLVPAVFRVKLFNLSTRIVHGGQQLRQELLPVKQSGQPVRSPGGVVERRAVCGDEHELQLVAHKCPIAGVPDTLLDAGQRPTRTGRIPAPILEEHVGGSPRQASAETAQPVGIDPQAQVANRADGVREGDSAVDAEHMPDRSGTHAGPVEGAEPGHRDTLCKRDSGRVHH